MHSVHTSSKSSSNFLANHYITNLVPQQQKRRINSQNSQHQSLKHETKVNSDRTSTDKSGLKD